MLSGVDETKRRLAAEPLRGFPDAMGLWLWALQEVRRDTLKSVAGVDQGTLDWEGDDATDNTIGSLLYHIGLVEMSWLYLDILEKELPAEVQEDYPRPMADASGRLARVLEVPLDEHLARLERSRQLFLEALTGMTLDDWRRLRDPSGVDYRVTPEWAVFHLMEHEAGHAYQIRSMKRRAKRFLAGS